MAFGTHSKSVGFLFGLARLWWQKVVEWWNVYINSRIVVCGVQRGLTHAKSNVSNVKSDGSSVDPPQRCRREWWGRPGYPGWAWQWRNCRGPPSGFPEIQSSSWVRPQPSDHRTRWRSNTNHGARSNPTHRNPKFQVQTGFHKLRRTGWVSCYAKVCVMSGFLMIFAEVVYRYILNCFLLTDALRNAILLIDIDPFIM